MVENVNNLAILKNVCKNLNLMTVPSFIAQFRNDNVVYYHKKKNIIEPHHVINRIGP